MNHTMLWKEVTCTVLLQKLVQVKTDALTITEPQNAEAVLPQLHSPQPPQTQPPSAPRSSSLQRQLSDARGARNF